MFKAGCSAFFASCNVQVFSFKPRKKKLALIHLDVFVKNAKLAYFISEK